MFSCYKIHDRVLFTMYYYTTQEGCWGCFDDIERLNKKSFSILIHHCLAIYNAIKIGHDHCYISEGHEVHAMIKANQMPITNLYLPNTYDTG